MQLLWNPTRCPATPLSLRDLLNVGLIGFSNRTLFITISPPAANVGDSSPNTYVFIWVRDEVHVSIFVIALVPSARAPVKLGMGCLANFIVQRVEAPQRTAMDGMFPIPVVCSLWRLTDGPVEGRVSESLTSSRTVSLRSCR
jgi:hypothetical protein